MKIAAKEPSDRFNYAVHALRAIATAMVFGVHLFDSFGTYFFPDDPLLAAAMPYLKRFGTFGVELFFMISGYVIMSSLKKYDLSHFLLRRLLRIYPLFAFFTFVFFGLNAATRHHPESLSVQSLVLNLSFLDIYFGTQALSPNAWSLTYEANFYVLAGVGCFLLRSRALVPLMLFAAASLAFVWRFPIAAYFLSGAVLYELRGLQPKSLNRGTEFAILAVWCFLAANIDRGSASAANVVLWSASGIFFFLVTTPNGGLTRLATVRPVYFLGTISYSFYLAHPYAYLPMRLMFQKLALGTWSIWGAAAVYFPSITIAAVVTGYCVHRVLEVAPYQAVFGETVFKRRFAARAPEPVPAASQT